MTAETTRQAGPSLKSVAMPAQHGGWSFVLEPALVGVLLAPTFGGLLLGVAAFMIFLLDQPLRVAVKDRRKGKYYARTRLAERAALVYAGIGGLAITGVVLFAQHPFWIPLLLAVPLALVQLRLDLRNQARSASAEIAGALALGTVAPAIVLMAGWPLAAALGLWAALALRDISAVLYVRARLRLEKGKPAEATPTLLAHILLIGGLGGLSAAGLTPPLALVGGLLLAGRALLGLSRWRKPSSAVQTGVREVFFGLAYCALLVLGYRV
ncbi:MAG: YwiC-like family protein [Anaerolineae bacterium]|nr:YwiC-like family protein [Anaerolineae bacterium]